MEKHSTRVNKKGFRRQFSIHRKKTFSKAATALVKEDLQV